MVEIVSFAGIFFQVVELPRSIGCGFGKNERLQVVASFVTVSTGVLMIEVLPFSDTHSQGQTGTSELGEGFREITWTVENGKITFPLNVGLFGEGFLKVSGYVEVLAGL